MRLVSRRFGSLTGLPYLYFLVNIKTARQSMSLTKVFRSQLSQQRGPALECCIVTSPGFKEYRWPCVMLAASCRNLRKLTLGFTLRLSMAVAVLEHVPGPLQDLCLCTTYRIMDTQAWVRLTALTSLATTLGEDGMLSSQGSGVAGLPSLRRFGHLDSDNASQFFLADTFRQTSVQVLDIAYRSPFHPHTDFAAFGSLREVNCWSCSPSMITGTELEMLSLNRLPGNICLSA